MAKFLLLLHSVRDRYADESPEAYQRIVADYTAWAEKLEGEGRVHGAHKLADDAGRRVSSAGGGLSVVDGPYSEAREVLGGFFVVEAADYDDAVALARECPHLRYHETLDVRLIEH